MFGQWVTEASAKSYRAMKASGQDPFKFNQTSGTNQFLATAFTGGERTPNLSEYAGRFPGSWTLPVCDTSTWGSGHPLTSLENPLLIWVCNLVRSGIGTTRARRTMFESRLILIRPVYVVGHRRFNLNHPSWTRLFRHVNRIIRQTGRRHGINILSFAYTSCTKLTCT